MDLKLFGALLIIAASGAVGYCVVSSYHRQERVLRDMLRMIDYMECELEYRLTPLPQLCRQAAGECSGDLGRVLIHFADELDAQVCPDTERCMQAAVLKSGKMTATTAECVLELGRSVGRFDLHGQLKGLSALRNICERKLSALENNKDARLQSYQALGICAGAAIAVLLI